MQKHLMLDLETLGRGDRVHVPVLQVGGAVFSFDPSKEEPIDIHEKWSVNFGLDLATKDVVSPAVCPETMKWWKGRPDDVREAVFFPKNLVESDAFVTYPPPHHAADKMPHMMDRLFTWLGENPKGEDRCLTIWSNGVSDFQWLTGLFNRYNMVPPWAYNAPRDYRTLRSLAHAKNGGPLPPRPQIGHSHNGADDAEWQAYMLGKYLTVLGISEVP